MTRVSLDPCAIQVSDRDRANAFHRDALDAEAIPRGAGFAWRLGPVRLDAHGRGAQAAPLARVPVAPGNGDLCFAWDGTEAEARAPLARHGVVVDLGPVARNGARGAGVSLCFRDPDGSLIECVTCP